MERKGEREFVRDAINKITGGHCEIFHMDKEPDINNKDYFKSITMNTKFYNKIRRQLNSMEFDLEKGVTGSMIAIYSIPVIIDDTIDTFTLNKK